MNDFSFARPELWPWLLLTPLLWWGVYALLQLRVRARLAFGAELQGRLPQPWARATRLSAALLCLHLCVMEPRYGAETVQVERRGLDIIFALDTSRSMLARDAEPTRLAAARRDVLAVLPELRGGDRAALVAFAGRARRMVPLTHDMDSFRQLLEGVDENAVLQGGSDLAAALERCLALVEEANYNTSVIVLLTDGEDREGRARAMAGTAAERGVVVHAVGYGSPRGSKILLEVAGRQRFLTDDKGEDVVSSLDIDSLRAVVEETGGEFLQASRMVLPLQELKRKRLDPLSRRGFDPEEETVFKTRFQWVLLPAMLLLLIEMILCRGSRRS